MRLPSRKRRQSLNERLISIIVRVRPSLLKEYEQAQQRKKMTKEIDLMIGLLERRLKILGVEMKRNGID